MLKPARWPLRSWQFAHPLRGRYMSDGTGNTLSISEKMGGLVSQFRYDSIPEAVLARGKLLILDAVGIALSSTQDEFAHRLLTSFRSFNGREECSLIGLESRLSLRDAVVMNAALIHGLDYDDTHIRAIVHPTASAFSCALGVAEQMGASGRSLLTAYVLGVETIVRIADAAKGHFQKAGYHPTGLVAHFSCAMQAGWLYGLTPQQLATAQGIAASTASGTQEFLVEGAWNKRLHPGWACVAGITAARLAQNGFVAISKPYEGRSGLYKGHLGPLERDVDYDVITAGLGKRWDLLDVAVKPYPICHMIHACADIALALRKKMPAQLPGIRSIVVRIPAETIHVIAEPEERKIRPNTEYEAKFSVQYVVAACLARARFGPEELAMASLHDPVILALAEKVRIEIDEKSSFPAYFSGGVTIEDEHGNQYQDYEPVNRGAGERALTSDDIVVKYRKNALHAVPETRAERILEAVLGMERLSARELAHVLKAA